MKRQKCTFAALSVTLILIVMFSYYRLMPSWSPRVQNSMCYDRNRWKLVKPRSTLVTAARQAAEDPVFPALRDPRLAAINFSTVGARSCEDVQLSASAPFSSIPRALRPVYTEEEKLVILLTLHVFVRSMERSNLSYFLLGGTLLGSYRNHGFIAWDDDIDVIMNVSDKGRVKNALSDTSTGELLLSNSQHWKFALAGLRRKPQEEYLWPFIDIFFFCENENYIWEENHGLRDGLIYHKHNIFPLSLRPFEGALLPVPRDTDSVLRNVFDPDVCASPSMCHKCNTNYEKRETVACAKLRDVYPLVHRVNLGHGMVRETLQLGNRVLKVVDAPDPDPSQESNDDSLLTSLVQKFKKTFLL